MVLIVVLSVFGGFENLLKDTVLSRTPHINIERVKPWLNPEEHPGYNIEEDWRSLEQSMSSLEGVESAYALVNDFILFEHNGAMSPASMQAIDTENTYQIDALQKLIKPDNGTADMGLGETDVLSSIVAKSFVNERGEGIQIGDIIQIHTNRNLRQIQPAFERVGSTPAWEAYSEQIGFIINDINTLVKPAGDKEAISITAITYLYTNSLISLRDSNLRSREKEIIESVRDHIADSLERTTERPDDSGDYRYNNGHMQKAIALLRSLEQLDTNEEDINDIKTLQSVVLPKDLEVVGIYQDSPHARGPAVFVPLPTGQDLVGLGDGVRGIALRLDDPYRAQRILEEVILPNMPEGGEWRAKTWMQDHAE